jgi:hypothetical protein
MHGFEYKKDRFYQEKKKNNPGQEKKESDDQDVNTCLPNPPRKN